MLTQERKISEPVATVLKSMNTSIDEEKSVNDTLLNVVKGCGLCRDISKYEVPSIE